MRLFLILTVSLSALSSSWAASGFVGSFEKDDVTGDYLHPKPEAFTDFRLSAPCPTHFCEAILEERKWATSIWTSWG